MARIRLTARTRQTGRDRAILVGVTTGDPDAAAESIAELKELAESADVVILDISLPEMDGTEILRRIREDSALHDLPVVALTAHAMVGDREKYLAAGFNDYVAKPILDMNVLFSTIQRWAPGT